MNPSIKNFKIFMTINELTPLANTLKETTEKIILFGSCATGKDTSESDMDLLTADPWPQRSAKCSCCKCCRFDEN